MRKWFATVVLCAISLVSLRADITVIQTMTMEGAAAAMMPPGQLPKTTMRIKGMKSRADIEAGGVTVTAITDLTSKQVIMLMADSKTAQVMTPGSVAAGGTSVAVPQIDMSLKPTGKTQVIDGASCAEHTFTFSMDMATMGGAQVPPEAAAAMNDNKMVMKGSIWIAKDAPGAAEWMAFTKAAIDSHLLTAVSGMKPGQPGGLDKLLEASAAAPGLPYLTEVTMRFEGTGPMIEVMNKMGDMKMTQKITSVTTGPISDDIFKVPEGYTIEKK